MGRAEFDYIVVGAPGRLGRTGRARQPGLGLGRRPARGTGLRLADAAVLPGQVSGSTAAPAMLIGYRAAGFTLDDR